jgi:hypothetical protein
MLNLRLYRGAWVLIVLALVVVAFSLHGRSPAITTTLAPDAFDGDRASRTLSGLVERYPERRPGSDGDNALADRVRAGFVRQFGESRVRERRIVARTIDGEQELRTIIAERPGRSSRRVVVLAHRDAAGRGAAAELSGTAALLELAEVFSGRVTRRTLTLVSTSGGSGGGAGARDWARHPGGPVDAVVVLGDPANTRTRKPWVVPWSNERGFAPDRLVRTAEEAVREESGESAGQARAPMAFLRQAFPLTVSEQGPINSEGVPAVLIGPGGELGAAATDEISAERLRVFGRAALRTMTALDNGPDIQRKPLDGLVVRGQVIPVSAIRLLGAALLIPVLIGAIDGVFRVKRRRGRPGRWILWVLAGALAPMLTALLAVILRAIDLLGSAPAAPVAPDHVGVQVVGLAFATAVLAAGWWFVRLAAVRRLDLGRLERLEDGAGPAAGVGLVIAVAALLVWLRNPYAALFIVPAAHLWLLALAPEVQLRRITAIGAVAVGFAPFALAALGYAIALDATPIDLAWIALLAVAGGHTSPVGVLLGSVVLGAGASALVAVLRVPRHRERRGPPTGVVSRGPLTYAGPGSLGGTESALRR